MEKQITLNLTEKQAESLVIVLLAYELALKKEICLCTYELMKPEDRVTYDEVFDHIQVIRGELPESISKI